jgi:hypothetical protein
MMTHSLRLDQANIRVVRLYLKNDLKTKGLWLWYKVLSSILRTASPTPKKKTHNKIRKKKENTQQWDWTMST